MQTYIYNTNLHISIYLGIAGIGVPSLSIKRPPALRTHRWWSDRRECLAVVGLSFSALMLFFRGENSSSLNTSKTAKSLKNKHDYKMIKNFPIFLSPVAVKLPFLHLSVQIEYLVAWLATHPQKYHWFRSVVHLPLIEKHNRFYTSAIDCLINSFRPPQSNWYVVLPDIIVSLTLRIQRHQRQTSPSWFHLVW